MKSLSAGLTNQPYMAYSTCDNPLVLSHLILLYIYVEPFLFNVQPYLLPYLYLAGTRALDPISLFQPCVLEFFPAYSIPGAGVNLVWSKDVEVDY